MGYLGMIGVQDIAVIPVEAILLSLHHLFIVPM